MSRSVLLIRIVLGAGVGFPLLFIIALHAASTGGLSPLVTGTLVLAAAVLGGITIAAAWAACRDNLREVDQNARELARHRRELSILYRVIRQVSAAVDPESIRDLILNVLIEGLHANSCHLLLLESHLTEGILCSMSRGQEHVQVLRDELSAFVGPDVDAFTVPSGSETLSRAATFLQPTDSQSVCWLPIVIQDQRIGIVFTLRDGSPLNDDELELFRTLSSGLAMAVENARLYELAVIDSLTGLYVKRYFDEHLRQEAARATRYDTELSVLMADLDRFKQINDECGHTVGDEVLRSVAQAIAGSTRDSDLPARWGGDEFAVILPETGADAAERTADRIREAVAAIPPPRELAGCTTTVSIGVASFPGEVTMPETLVELADKALYEAKRRGRNRVIRAADSLRAAVELPHDPDDQRTVEPPG